MIGANTTSRCVYIDTHRGYGQTTLPYVEEGIYIELRPCRYRDLLSLSNLDHMSASQVLYSSMFQWWQSQPYDTVRYGTAQSDKRESIGTLPQPHGAGTETLHARQSLLSQNRTMPYLRYYRSFAW